MTNKKVNFPGDFSHRKSPGVPLRSAKELAEEFGLKNHQALGAEMRHSKVPIPNPINRSKSTLTTTNSWFVPSEMRAWWKLHQESKLLKETK